MDGHRCQRDWLRHVVLPRRWVRELDRRAIEEFGIPGPVLMENAGRGATDVLERLGIHGRVVVCCGKGNNAGDGFVVARHLDLRGFDVLLLLAFPGESLTGDALLNYQIANRAGLPMKVLGMDLSNDELKRCLTEAEWIVDGLLGTGAVGDPRPPFDAIIEAINFARDAGARVFALDLPSGWDCDSGEPGKPCVRADHTVTFAVMKPGFLKPHAAPFVGQVEVVDIGVPRRLVLEVAEQHARGVPSPG
ncbi:NAD(P)HX epimerase / NAD(P)HX dehydratase [Thermogutta terrifontis]|uniref:NAD(P)H-hydrate epimerase n=1 Tax=Thermogutta terrifontis TaxID=1331910 RepID=A0A286RF68_9BACT|nr:NAD(P)H-hydrate epimerase [Thermogutta terrifontis]ASV74604.1 NAD(P)HX epimerase / NAD(P)HX dehydratase [Thermogutta terrifontis]